MKENSLSSPSNPQFDPQSPGGPAPIQLDIQAQPYAAGVPAISPAPGRPPVENPAWNGWDVVLITVLAFFTILVFQFAILMGAHYLRYPRTPLGVLAQKPILLLVSQFLIDGAVALYLILLVEGKYHVQFWPAIRWNWPSAAWKLLLLGAVMLLGLGVLERYLPMPQETPFEKLFARPLDAYLISIIAVSLGPLVEELFFRGFLYPVLARRWGIAWGVFLSALPFAALHLPQYGWAWGAMLVILIVGIVCGLVRAVTKSVGASFLVHVGYNGSQMMIALVATHGFRHLEKAVLFLH